ncbi:MAG: hypothetical protein K2H52_04195 [Lachnospiraceae bacterium]|nr:hypothetical protein [Lachnospiraceae bacterium]
MSMLFPVFLGIVVTLFFALPAKWRPVFLLAASYGICGWMDWRSLLVLVVISFSTWLVGRKIEKMLAKGKRRGGKICVQAAVSAYVLILCVYKYMPVVLKIADLKGRAGESVLRNLVMPIGLSFYLFQAIGYLTDVYKEKIPAEKNFVHLSCYLAFFPKLVSGPIESGQDFLPQLETSAAVTLKDRGRLSTALSYMLWGYFMKMVVADRLAVTVNQIFAEPSLFDSIWLIIGVFFYTIQIYCDFAGYSYIAIGCARIFGIRLTENFKAPYLAVNITDFWRRWHVSLSAWLRNYIYIPLGGNRKGFARKCINTMIVFLICGMWHGAGFHFAVWGILHGVYSVVDAFVRQKGWKIRGGRIITFISVSFAWIFFKADNLKAAIAYITAMFTAGIRPDTWNQTRMHLQLNEVEIALIVLSICVVWAVDLFCSRKKLHLPVLIQQKQNAVRYLIFYLLIIAIFIFGMYGPGYHTEQFIYMQF